MTTSVTIKHEGPAIHDVMVEVIDQTSGGPTTAKSIRLKMGESSEAVSLYAGRTISIHEADKEQPPVPAKPAPAPAPLKADTSKALT